MQTSNSAIPIYLSLNASRNARGKAEDDHCRNRTVGGGGPKAGRPPPFLFCCAHPLQGVPLTFQSAFPRGSMVNDYCFSDAYASANCNVDVNRNGDAGGMILGALRSI